MVNFIKLSNMIINTKFIRAIVCDSKKYYININYNISGNLFWFSDDKFEIEICAIEKPSDYKIITDWIDKN